MNEIRPHEHYEPDDYTSPEDQHWLPAELFASTDDLAITEPPSPEHDPPCSPWTIGAERDMEIESTVWIPAEVAYDLNEPLTTIRIADEVCHVDTRTLAMAYAFNGSDEDRAALNHDCAVFALACESDNPLDGIAFSEQGLRVEHMVDYFDGSLDDAIAAAEQTEAGTILYLSGMTDAEEADAEAKEDLLADVNNHYLIKATPPQKGEAWYFSKVGLNPVGLTTMKDTLQIYPAQRIGVSHGLRTWTYPQDIANEPKDGTR